ncbi:hypothetical protein MPSEU_000658000 [Mayamaea pseudoterrestris]|nr:hypothetical protein MPSEU_000658000 [Mayamaea pseudoterrestris]
MPGFGRSYEELLNALIAYRDKHGHCRVPQYYKDDPALGQWVGKQRSRLVHQLDDPKRQRLSSIGFDWESQEERNERAFNEKFQRLVFYKAQHGNTLVPKSYKDDQELGNWVSMQRILWKKNRLSQERVEKLDSLQFTWVLANSNKTSEATRGGKLEGKWLEKLHCLMHYREKVGDCNVPKSYKQDGLGYWVNNQRAAHAKGDLSDARKELLDDIGFVWRISKHSQKRQYSEDASSAEEAAFAHKRQHVMPSPIVQPYL